MITLTEENAHTVIAVLDEARLHTGCRSCRTSITHTIQMLREVLGVTEQDRAALVTKTALRERD